MSTIAPPIPKEPPPITKPSISNAEVVDLVKAVMQKIFDCFDKLDATSAFQYFSDDPDTRYVENGFLYPSLSALKETFIKMLSTLESLEQTVKSWDIIVLSNDAALATLPVHAKIKAKGRPEYQFDYVSSSLVQKRNGRWLLVRGHESWLNAADVVAAITPQTTSAN